MAFSLFSRVISTVRLPSMALPSFTLTQSIHSLTRWTEGFSALPGGAWSSISVRTNVRNHFPRARETKRIVVHGYQKRMSTYGGRRILMRRILKGRHILSH